MADTKATTTNNDTKTTETSTVIGKSNDQAMHKLASELTKEDLKKLQKIDVKINRVLSQRTKKFYYQIEMKFGSIKLPFNDKDRFFTDVTWMIVCDDLKKDTTSKDIVIRDVPIRLFSGKKTDPETEEVRKYTRYQAFISDNIRLSGFFNYQDLVAIEKFCKYQITETTNNISFANDEF